MPGGERIIGSEGDRGVLNLSVGLLSDCASHSCS